VREKDGNYCPHDKRGCNTIFFQSGKHFLDAEVLFLPDHRLAMPGLWIAKSVAQFIAPEVYCSICLQPFFTGFTSVPVCTDFFAMVRYEQPVSKIIFILPCYADYQYIPGTDHIMVDFEKYHFLVKKEINKTCSSSV